MDVVTGTVTIMYIAVEIATYIVPYMLRNLRIFIYIFLTEAIHSPTSPRIYFYPTFLS